MSVHDECARWSCLLLPNSLTFYGTTHHEPLTMAALIKELLTTAPLTTAPLTTAPLTTAQLTGTTHHCTTHGGTAAPPQGCTAHDRFNPPNQEHWGTLCNLVQRDSLEDDGQPVQSSRPRSSAQSSAGLAQDSLDALKEVESRLAAAFSAGGLRIPPFPTPPDVSGQVSSVSSLEKTSGDRSAVQAESGER